jgi:hypothetical protein
LEERIFKYDLDNLSAQPHLDTPLMTGDCGLTFESPMMHRTFKEVSLRGMCLKVPCCVEHPDR